MATRPAVTPRRIGTPVFVHWSVSALCLFFLGVGIEWIFTAATAMAAYLAMILIHEFGHRAVARRRRCEVLAIELFPLHGRCLYVPNDALDHAFISWGGALAQFIVAVPCAIFVMTVGYTRVDPFNAVLAILGFFGPLIALLNLIPVAPLDGKAAWSLIPLLWSRRRRSRSGPRNALEALEEARKKALRNR